MKRFVTLLSFTFCLLLGGKAWGQCSNFSRQYPSATQTILPSESRAIANDIHAGDWAAYDVTFGVTYTWSTCGYTAFDTKLTLWNTAHTEYYDYNDDNADICGSGSYQSFISWRADFTGTVHVLLSQYNSSTSCASNSTNMTIIWSAPNACTPQGDETTYGNGSWIGYVYGSGAGEGSFTYYNGYITEAEQFDRDNGTNSISGATTNLCVPLSVNYAVRYRMTKNFPAGLYRFTIGGDDGVRLKIDGTQVCGSWIAQSYTTFTSDWIYLDGNKNLEMEYYQVQGYARRAFSYFYIPAAVSAAGASPEPVCVGDSVSLSATTTGSQIKWYTAATDGTYLGTTNSGEALRILPTQATYYAEAVYSAPVNEQFSYTGNVQTVTLPTAGTYQLECWGANGGAGYSAFPNNGGKGGYSKATYTTIAPTTLYVGVGQAQIGTGTEMPANWNGGGGSGNYGGAGGGATHIATTNNRGVLANYNSYRSEILMVAGGGGGSGYSSSTSVQGGDGGGTSGAAGNRGTTKTAAGGGTQSTGGSGGVKRDFDLFNGDTWDNDNGQAGSFGQGGGPTATGGGGGGGFFGGGSGAGDGSRDGAGGGGSGYIGSNGNLSGGTTIMYGGGGFVANPNATGHGHVRISYTHSFTTPRVPVNVTIISCLPPDPPDCAVLTAPANGATGVAITGTTLTWESAAYATSYKVYFGTTNLPDSVNNINGTTYNLGTLTAGATYYWKIVPTNSAGDASNCPTYSFTTLPLPTCATLTAPTNTATGVAITGTTLTWNSAANADKYYVYFGTSSPPPLIDSTTAPTITYSLGSTLAPNTRYYWRIVPRNNSGTATGCPTYNFTTLPLPDCATSPSPADGEINVAISGTSLTWSSAANAASYDVYFGTTNPPDSVTNVTGTSYSLGTLTPNETYYWKIVPRNSSGVASGCSAAAYSFTTLPLPACATLTAPADEAIDVAIAGTTLTWSSAANAASYDVYFGATYPPAYVTNTSNTFYTPTGTLIPGETYYWNIISRNSSGIASDCDTFSFITQSICAPPYLSPVSDVESNSAVITWASGGNSTEIEYLLEYGMNGDYSNSTPISVTQPYTLDNLQASRRYCVRMRTVCSVGDTSAYSNERCFETQLCHRPTNVAASGIYNTIATISWLPGSGTENEWSLEYGVLGTFDSPPTRVSTSPSYQLENLQADTWYNVRVRTVCGANEYSAYSNIDTFKTQQIPCDDPTYLTADGRTSSTIIVSWRPGGNETEWKITYTPLQGGQSGQVIGIRSSPHTLIELQSNTLYKICVIAVCSPGVESSPDNCINERTEVGIPDIKLDNSVKLYPNPASDKLTVEMEGKFNTIEITNTLGQMLYRAAVTDNQMQIDVSGYSAGMYYVKLQGDNGMVTKKFVKE